jgi:hypothetical protein
MKILNKIINASLLAVILSSLSSSALASDNKLTKEEFLARVSSNSMVLDRGPVFAIPDAVRMKVVEEQKKRYPEMRPDNLYYYYYRDNNFEYSIFWEWDRFSCRLRIEGLDKTTHRATGKTADPDGQQIDKKFCEKLYGRKL